MKKYILNRLIISFVTIFALITFTFFLLKNTPGSPFDSSKLSAEQIDILNAYYGFDKPIMTQYFKYLVNLLQGDLGICIRTSEPIIDIIGRTLPNSVTLGLNALLTSLILGISLGALSALNRGKFFDKLSMSVVILFVSVPSFVIASVLQYYLTYVVRLFPTINDGSFTSFVLPSFCLSLSTIALLSRLMRTSMLEVINADYVKTAKSKGLTKKRIIISHQIRNSLLPIVTVLGPITASLLTGTFIIEKMFVIDGLGKYFVDAVNSGEHEVTMALTIVFGSFLVICNFLVDLLYGVVDPRIRVY